MLGHGDGAATVAGIDFHLAQHLLLVTFTHSTKSSDDIHSPFHGPNNPVLFSGARVACPNALEAMEGLSAANLGIKGDEVELLIEFLAIVYTVKAIMIGLGKWVNEEQNSK